jgi:lipoprotein-anchoring transpeptidase ErfK/SrfK
MNSVAVDAGRFMFKFLVSTILATSFVTSAVAAEAKFEAKTFEILGTMDGTQLASATMPQNQFDKFKDDDVSGPNREVIAFETKLAPGSILVRTTERKLYFILPSGQAVMYRVGVGREGFSWSGQNKISRKAQWPDWRPPAVMIRREAERGHMIPDFMAGGPDNPLGARAMYIGSTDFRIHGTTQPWSIGHAVSSGCIRMLNEHVIELYNRVKVGAEVVVE